MEPKMFTFLLPIGWFMLPKIKVSSSVEKLRLFSHTQQTFDMSSMLCKSLLAIHHRPWEREGREGMNICFVSKQNILKSSINQTHEENEPFLFFAAFFSFLCVVRLVPAQQTANHTHCDWVSGALRVKWKTWEHDSSYAVWCVWALCTKYMLDDDSPAPTHAQPAAHQMRKETSHNWYSQFQWKKITWILFFRLHAIISFDIEYRVKKGEGRRRKKWEKNTKLNTFCVFLLFALLRA